jgi:hypothetical protein
MRLKRDYKIGALLRFKWYDNWRDEFVRPDNFRVIEGTVDSNAFMDRDEVIVYNEHEQKFYAVRNEYILKEF